MDPGGCPQKRMTRSWSATSRLEAVDGKTMKQTQSRRTTVKSTASKGGTRDAELPFEIRGLCSPTDNTSPSVAASPHSARNQKCRRLKASDSFVAHALSVPRRDSSRRPAQFGHRSSTNAPHTTKQTQSRRTTVKSTASKGGTRDAELPFEIRGLCSPTDNTSPSVAASPHSARNQKCHRLKASDSFVAHALSVPRRDSSRRPAQFGHRSSTNAPHTTKQTQSRRTTVKSTASKGGTRDAELPFEIRGLCSPTDNTSPSVAASPHSARNQKCHRLKASDSFVAHALSVPRRDSSRRPAQFGHRSSTNAPHTTKQTQSRRTTVKSTASKGGTRDAELPFEIRGLCSPTDNTSPSVAASPHSASEPKVPPPESVRFLCGARSQRAASRLFSTPGAVRPPQFH